jgi:hypothetical protein
MYLTFITFFRYVDELDHVAMVESGSSDSDNTVTQGERLCTVGTGQSMYSYGSLVHITAIQRAYFIPPKKKIKD